MRDERLPEPGPDPGEWAGSRAEAANAIVDQIAEFVIDRYIVGADEDEHEAFWREFRAMFVPKILLAAKLRGTPAEQLIADGDRMDVRTAVHDPTRSRCEKQIDQLASFILENFDEPSRDEGAIECAIRLLQTHPERKDPVPG